ncbi:double zinc ribbon domain-containing protein [Paenibacillus turpanensis]|uniref:double zinc ribbon domain-containing protein n=1 Tax=Paenibacillus turpanensis TaxID=2689078 RepID=UPI00140D965E|nr:zinc ribbon domain-containing protein [Paenibacillus turpanensis]
MAVKRCGSCGESNSEHAMMCLVCGSSLREAPIEGTPETEKEYSGVLSASTHVSSCPYCSERLEPGALKCKYCGSTVNRARTMRPTYTPSSSSSMNGCFTILLFVVTFFIPIVGLIVGGFVSFSDDPDKSSIGKALFGFGFVMLVILFLFALIR